VDGRRRVPPPSDALSRWITALGQSLKEQIASLPEDVQDRIWAVEQAASLLSGLKPRIHVEDGAPEVIALAEELLDWRYGDEPSTGELTTAANYATRPESSSTRIIVRMRSARRNAKRRT
jgi:hypothetical protein